MKIEFLAYKGGYGEVRVLDDGFFNVKIDGSTFFKNKLEYILTNGLVTYSEFSHPGIPGQIKTVAPIRSTEDVLKVLYILKDEYKLIQIISEDDDGNITEIYNKINYNPEDKEYKIIYNGERVESVPKIEFDATKDLIVCNGLLVVADHISGDEYPLGFFKDNDCIPIAFECGGNSPIFIDLYETDHKKVCIIHYGYEVDLKSLLKD